MVEAFEGNKAETHTMLPTIGSFMTAHQLRDVTVVADAGMVPQTLRAPKYSQPATEVSLALMTPLLQGSRRSDSN
jgi:hypothetical protein